MTLTSGLWIWFFLSLDNSQKEQSVFLEDERVKRERLAAKRMRRAGREDLPNKTVQ